MDAGPLTDVVVIEAAGEIWRLVNPWRASRYPEPVLSTGEVRALELQMERWSIHHPKHLQARKLTPEMVRALAAIKRVFRVGDERALIEDWDERP